MNYYDVVNYLEDEPVLINHDYYFHAFEYNHINFINMINKGVKAPILLKKYAEGNNGYFYVSLTKNNNCELSIYHKLSFLPMFIINDKINTIKTRNFKRFGYYPISLTKSPLPFRESAYDDEYQKFLKVSPNDIIAIQYNILKNTINNNLKDTISILKAIILDLESQNKDLPIIDYSTSKIINKNKVLKLKI